MAQHPEKGHKASSEINIQFTLTGAFLLEMTLEEQIEVRENKLVLKEMQRIDHPIHSKLAELIRKSSKPRKMRYWISKMAMKNNRYKRHIEDKLVGEHILRIENKKFLGLIPYRRSYLRDSRIRTALIHDYKSKLTRGGELSNQDLVMLGLMHSSNMASILSSNREEKKMIREKLKEKSKESAISVGVGKAIQEVQAAVMASVMASTTATTIT
jgi:hypothetical protein